MRVLGLDVGSVRIGVAISDEDQIIAQPLSNIDGKKSPVQDVEELCLKYSVKTVIIGLPLSMNGGDRGISSRRAKAFGEALKTRLGLEVIFFDERFSTSEANKALISASVKRKKRKDFVDKIAAALILQGYLDQHRDSELLLD
jgi:putative Holliday junction resolvase